MNQKKEEVIRMKWEKYNQLTPEEKEEYDYKFGDEELVLSNMLGVLFIRVYTLLWVMLGGLTAALIYTNRLGAEEAVRTLALGLLDIGAVMLIICVFVFFVELAYSVYRRDKMEKWVDSKFKEVREVKE